MTWSNPHDYTVEVRNRYKGLDLIDRVSDELWMEVHDIIREQRSRPSPRKRNARRQSGCLRRLYKQLRKEEKEKSKGQRERYTQWMQRSREKQGELRRPSSMNNAKNRENNRMGKTRDLFKKTGDIKGTFHARMGMTKDRNSKALTEAREDAARMRRRTVQKRCWWPG